LQLKPSERHGPRDIERMVDQRLDPLNELRRTREAGVKVERRLIDPARMEVKEPRIAR
jgi:hypothetical protein